MKKFIVWISLFLFTTTSVFAVPNIIPVKDESEGSSGGDVNVTQIGGTAVSTGNGTTDSGTQRVTISSDSTGQTRLASNDGVDIGNVDVASSALPTGASTSANQTTIIGHVDGVEGLLTTIDADTSILSVLSKAEDALHVTGDTGIVSLGVQKTADGALAGDGDYAPYQVDENGFLKVNIKAGAGSGGTASTDDGTFTAGAGSGTPAMGFVTSDSVDSGDVGVLGMLANRQLKVTLFDSAGVEASVGGGTQYDEDTASADGQKLNMAGVTRADVAASQVGTDGDRSTLIVDSSGRLWTNGSGVTQPVSGTVTANAGTNLNTSALSLETTSTSIKNAVEIMDDWDESDRAKVNPIVGNAGVTGGSGTVDAGTQRVVLATDVALPAGTNAIGKLSANSGVDIGDVDVTSVIPGTSAANLGKAEDAAHSSADAGVFSLSVRADELGFSTTTDGDYQAVKTDSLGRLWVREGNPCTDHANLTSAVINTASSGNVEIVALASGQTIYVCGYSLVADAAVDVQFIYGTGTACATGETDLTGPWGFSANGGIAQGNAGSVQFKTASANALCIENSAAVQVSGHVTYRQVASSAA